MKILRLDNRSHVESRPFTTRHTKNSVILESKNTRIIISLTRTQIIPQRTNKGIVKFYGHDCKNVLKKIYANVFNLKEFKLENGLVECFLIKIRIVDSDGAYLNKVVEAINELLEMNDIFVIGMPKCFDFNSDLLVDPAKNEIKDGKIACVAVLGAPIYLDFIGTWKYDDIRKCVIKSIELQ